MGTEIERKYLINPKVYRQWLEQCTSHPQYADIKQGYLNADKNRTVRVRHARGDSCITVKSGQVGLTRAEYEYHIPTADAAELLELCLAPIITKRRFTVEADDGNIWTIDSFKGELEGLILAEIELKSESQPFETPWFVGEEVSHDFRFANSYLALHSAEVMNCLKNSNRGQQ